MGVASSQIPFTEMANMAVSTMRIRLFLISSLLFFMVSNVSDEARLFAAAVQCFGGHSLIVGLTNHHATS